VQGEKLTPLLNCIALVLYNHNYATIRPIYSKVRSRDVARHLFGEA